MCVCVCVFRSGLGLGIVLGYKVDKFSFGRLWCPWSVGRRRWTPEGGTFGN